eukprot:XP_012823283.1 PREDICTED: protein CutA isoform X2 [Xenopus tropicalis]
MHPAFSSLQFWTLLIPGCAFLFYMTPLLLRTVGIRAFSMASDSYASGSLSAAYVTCPNDTVAKDIARGLVERKLAACVNIIPQITSILGYRYAYHLQSVVHLVGCCEGVSLYHGKDSTIIHHCCFPLTSRSFCVAGFASACFLFSSGCTEL